MMFYLRRYNMNLKLLKQYHPDYEEEIQEMKKEILEYFSFIQSFSNNFPQWAGERYIDNLYIVHNGIRESAIRLYDVERNMIDISHLKDDEDRLINE
jgi:hypothetical protein